MGKLLLSLFLLLVINSAFCQNVFNAVYKIHENFDTGIVNKNPLWDSLKSDMEKAAKNAGGSYHVTHTLTFDDSDTSSFSKKLREELSKQDKNHFSYTVYCMPNRMVAKLEYEYRPPITNEHGNIVYKGPTLFVFDYANNVFTKNYFFNDSLTASCEKIDSTLLHFRLTGKTKKIKNWYCKQYVPLMVEYKDISVWSCDKLAPYIHPQLYSSDIKAGIVQIAYHGATMTLTTVSKVKDIETGYKLCRQEPIFNTVNLLELIIRCF